MTQKSDDKPLSFNQKELFRDIASLIAIYKFSNNGTAEQTAQKVLDLITKQEQASFKKILERIDEWNDNAEYMISKRAVKEIITAELGEDKK